MPRFGSVLSSLQAKIEEARISDLNYELGKFVQDTKCYLSSTFKGSSQGIRPSVPKSTSLPLFPSSFGASSAREDQEPCAKYKYRSSFRPPSDEDILRSGGDVIEEEDENEEEQGVNDSTVVEKFIRVIEASAASKDVNFANNTREDIRRKLAFSKPDFNSKKATNDLEVCFINEIVDEDVETAVQQPSSLIRSQSEYVSFKPLSSVVGEEEKSFADVAYQLAKCKQDAHRKMMIEKRNRKFHEVNTFNKLIGKSIEGSLNQEILSQMNTATIQVIFNDFHNKIERLNEELVQELMKKDELQIEQDSQLVDIDDLTQDLNRKR